MPKGISGSKTEVTGRTIKLHNESLHNSYSALRIVRTIVSSKVSWAFCVARMR